MSLTEHLALWLVVDPVALLAYRVAVIGALDEAILLLVRHIGRRRHISWSLHHRKQRILDYVCHSLGRGFEERCFEGLGVTISSHDTSEQRCRART